MQSTVSDTELALAAGKGDRAAFQHLLERHYDGIFRLAYRLCGHREEAEDIAQDVCVLLARKLAGFKAHAAFRTWLFRVVVNRVNDAQRQKTRLRRHNDAYGEVDAMRRADACQAQRDAQWLAEVMQHLPPDLRQTAALVVGEEMSHAQAGAVMGISEGTVSWRMNALKKALAKLAKEEA